MNFEGVRNAIYSRLASYTQLNAITNFIGYERPQDVQPEDGSLFPYTIIEDITGTPFDTKTSDCGNQLIQITTYCRPNASSSAVTLANTAAQAVYDALHKYDLVITGSNTINCLFDSTGGNLPDPDGVTRYKPMTFRVVYDDGT